MRKILPLLAVCLSIAFSASSQCPTGYVPASLNWDNLDFLAQDPTYISASAAQTQYFAFGTNRVTINHNYAISLALGENNSNTGEAGSFGTGEDVEFNGNGAITVTFQTAVQNVKFSLYDVDYGQNVSITALNGATPQNITIAKLSGTQLTVGGSGTTNATAIATAAKGAITDVADNSTDGTVNVTISGPVTSFTINVTAVQAKGQEKGSFWLSDIQACNLNAVVFPTNYYAVSQPFPNQPGYVLSAVDDTVLMINPANGMSKVLFADPTGNNINSMAYDERHKMLYYTYSLTGWDAATSRAVPNPNNKAIQRYNVATGELTTIVSNVNTLGIPTYGSGVESGGAAFYDGALYIGIEGINGDESKIWRIDFDAALNPLVPARQVFGVITDEHDWSDFAIKDGVLYDFDGKTPTGGSNIYQNIFHIDLQTGATLASYNSTNLSFVPRQVAVDWMGNMFNTGTAQTTATGTIVPYSNGTVNTAQEYVLTTGSYTPAGSWGDAAEAFKAMADFGDAPSIFDGSSPALHDFSSNLKLGSAIDYQWDLPGNPGLNADQEGSDDDGLAYVTIMNQGGNYQTNVSVFNNTGLNATLVAWLDIDGDNVFEESEGKLIVVPSNAGYQTIPLFWPNTASDIANNSYTYLRIRITTATTMTASTPSGYFPDGEVEDYRVLVTSSPLAVKLTGFEVKKAGNDRVSISWNVTDEEPGTKYEIEKGSDGQVWSVIHSRSAQTKSAKAAYQSVDASPYSGDNYYRLKIVKTDGSVVYSTIRKVVFEKPVTIQVTPNPASSSARLLIQSAQRASAHIRIVDMNGRVLFERDVVVEEGMNGYALPVQQLPGGMYQAEVWIDSKRYNQQLIVRK